MRNNESGMVEKSTSDVIAVIAPQNVSVIDWNINTENEVSIWDGWKYGFDIPQILTTSAGNTFYGFGVWQPEEYKNLSFGEVSTSEWLKTHGLNLSFGATSTDSETRYRFDVRWHEDTDADFMLQMQIPFK
ncbi:hypothetical protein LRP49_00730 [Enterovibrio sp. ZSDZ35]|uniref:Uncharacterized protein n=1 Tax=Enterovibrio qingdaonensis TaxID=2899818 RepID=A0ABT5QFF1_9GAMM|nr:hypothetical protein [Enterovibrio sp. ZSDZ35]MDD1779706.1 hypothetical protein [Enterovibrio sp. ZSDZ35]